MARPSASYEPKSPAQSVLHRLVLEHLETFLVETGRLREGRGLPRFVEREFREFLQCGLLAGGFARFRCAGCGLNRLVPFSCKGRICPSCGGRRMAVRAAHLVDRVFPAVPVRQWTLSLPYRIRYLLAWDHALCRAVVAVAMHTILGFLRRRIREAGLGVGQGGAVAIVQRFGAALNLNVHLHTLVADGVFVEDGLGGVRFETLPVLDDEDVAEILATLQRRVLQLLQRRGLVEACDGSQAPDALAEAEPVLAGITAASVVGTSAVGPRAGARLRRCGDPDAVVAPPTPGPRHARLEGFDLHANLVVPPRDRQRLERVCRYALRPPIAQDRLHLTRDGQVVLELRHRWTDGTTHLVFDPLELLERLAALTPRPRINLVLYYGVFAPHAKRRAWVIAAARGDLGMVTSVGRTRSGDGARGGCNGPAHRPPGQPCGPPGVRQPAADAVAPAAAPPGQTSSDWGGSSWAQLMRRSFGFDVLACSRCGGRLRLVATIDQRAVVDRILRHLGLPTDLPVPRPARAPPLGEAVRDVPFGGGTDVADVEPC